MSDGLSVDKKQEGEVTLIRLSGVIDERVQLQDLFNDVRSKVVMDLRGVDRINSCGVREWVNVIKTFPEDKELSFEKCSQAIVKQMNMISNFTGGAKVISFMAPYACEECDDEMEKLLILDEHQESIKEGNAPEFSCSACGELLEFDDIEEKYFQFASQQLGR